MIKLSFGRKPRETAAVRPSSGFADYCRDELERLKDSGESFDQAEFQAAVELALERLDALESEEDGR